MGAPVWAGEPAHPFPSHTAYTAGAIRPSVGSRDVLDRAVATFYDQWKKRYLRPAPTPAQLYIAYNREKAAAEPQAVSCSESHGYGMLLVAFLAGYDPQAQTEFDQLYAFFRAHPSSINPNLMAWQQRKGDRPRTEGNDSATDGDLDIAYALLLADAQWGSSGAVAYRKEALKVLAAIEKDEINPAIPSLKLGDWASGAAANDTRTSDFALNHFRVFAKVTGDNVWLQVINRCYAITERLQARYAPKTGLVPDFVRRLDSGDPVPAGSKFLESRFDGQYYYNACRFPWRVGTDYLLNGEPRAKAALGRINGFMRAKTGGDPRGIRAGYSLGTGKVLDEDDTSLAFVGPLAVGACIGPENQAWLDALWRELLGAPIEENDYFGNTLKLLSMVVVSGNWWTP